MEPRGDKPRPNDIIVLMSLGRGFFIKLNRMISVITPCFNLYKEGRQEWFDKMMCSVHEQTYQTIEHIVIDDGSSDATIELLKQYQAKGWISKLIEKEHVGIYHTMNQGIKAAEGKYINIMNTDDYITDNNFFKLSISEIEKNNADFSHGDRIIKSRRGGPDYLKRGNEKSAFFRMPFRHQTMIVKREVFDEVGLFDESYQVAADYKWILKMLLANKNGVYLSKVFICSLDGGASANKQRCIEEVSRIIFEVYGRQFKLTPNECQEIYLRKISFCLLFKIMINVKNNKIKKSLLYCFYLGLTNR